MNADGTPDPLDPAELPDSADRIRTLARRLAGQLPAARVAEGESLRRYTSFQIGGPADLFVEPVSVESLSAVLAAAHELAVPVTCLGGGTNLLVADAGVRGLVVRLGKAFAYIRETGQDEGGVDLEVGAATRFIRLAKDTVTRGLGGLEFAAGIPGWVGGAAQMNAGAFGGEISQTLISMTMVEMDGTIVEKQREQLHFSYRKLAFDRPAVIASLRFRLHRSSVGVLQQAVARVQEKRRRNQPAGYPNAGSIFKNPPGEYAGRLIEKAGLKGTTKGGAQVSLEHGNFIVNLGAATAADVRGLMGLVQEEVWRKCGVWLEPEVRLLGEFGEFGEFGQPDEVETSRP
ncbi:MAG: UDP-N-acetylmuramate dehydrogenase [Candidatus Binatia bacterium]